MFFIVLLFFIIFFRINSPETDECMPRLGVKKHHCRTTTNLLWGTVETSQVLTAEAGQNRAIFRAIWKQKKMKNLPALRKIETQRMGWERRQSGSNIGAGMHGGNTSECPKSKLQIKTAR